jgi:glycosyltransferase involved in cell wall biosynthesis
MKVLLVHNRYRSDSPSGENRVVDQEAAALEAAGNHVERFEYFSDDIAGWSRLRQALVPLRVVWSWEARRDLAAVLRRTRPDVVHVQNTFPLVSPSVLYSCRDERVPAVVTFHNYRQICPSGTLFRDGAVCHDCVGHLPLPAVRHGCYRSSPLATAPLALTTFVHRRSWRTLASAYVFVSKAERDLFDPLGLPANRMFVKANLVPATSSVIAVAEHKVVYVGRLSDTKGLPTLMASWDRYTRDTPEPRLRLVIAGTGPLEAAIREWSGGTADCGGGWAVGSRGVCPPGGGLTRRHRAVRVGGDLRPCGRGSHGGRRANDRLGTRITSGTRHRWRRRGRV